jgi:TetR/AcrR family transcriptional repressor of mexJK operon
MMHATTKPAPKRRPGRPTLSNEQLLDKALDLFLEQGFERTSIEAITAAAGMAKRTVYLRYGDKETLFKAALERAIEEWIIPLERLQAAETDDLEETLQSVGRILVDNIMTPAGLRLMRITNAESGRRPDIGVFTYRHGTARTIDYLADLFHRRIAPDGSGPAAWNEAAIAFLYLVVCGPPTMTAWGLTLSDAEIEHHTRYCVGLFLHGLLAPAAEASEAPPSADAAALQAENGRLKKLLLAAMLETATLKEQLESR